MAPTVFIPAHLGVGKTAFHLIGRAMIMEGLSIIIINHEPPPPIFRPSSVENTVVIASAIIEPSFLIVETSFNDIYPENREAFILGLCVVPDNIVIKKDKPVRTRTQQIDHDLLRGVIIAPKGRYPCGFK